MLIVIASGRSQVNVQREGWNKKLTDERAHLEQTQNQLRSDQSTYNQKWFPSPSFTQQINEERVQEESERAAFNKDVDNYNAQCAGKETNYSSQ